MTTTALDTLRDRVENLLKDSGNADWSTGELDDAVRLALHEMSGALPVRAVTTIDAVADTYEYSLSSITGLVCVVEVWYPYLSTHATYKRPHPVKWRMLDESTLFLDVEALGGPDAAYDLRVFYDKVQTLAGLDSASATTLSEAEQSALVVGAAGHAAVALAIDKVDTVVIGGNAPEDARKWGYAQLDEFRRMLADLASRDEADDARVGGWKLDKWDG